MEKGSYSRSFPASTKPICIHYNKKWKAASEKFERALAYQLPLNFLLFKRTLVPSCTLAPSDLSLFVLAASLRFGHSWHFLPNRPRRYRAT